MKYRYVLESNVSPKEKRSDIERLEKLRKLKAFPLDFDKKFQTEFVNGQIVGSTRLLVLASYLVHGRPFIQIHNTITTFTIYEYNWEFDNGINLKGVTQFHIDVVRAILKKRYRLLNRYKKKNPSLYEEIQERIYHIVNSEVPYMRQVDTDHHRCMGIGTITKGQMIYFNEYHWKDLGSKYYIVDKIPPFKYDFLSHLRPKNSKFKIGDFETSKEEIELLNKQVMEKIGTPTVEEIENFKKK